jgi:Virulence-associated protein E
MNSKTHDSGPRKLDGAHSSPDVIGSDDDPGFAGPNAPETGVCVRTMPQHTFTIVSALPDDNTRLRKVISPQGEAAADDLPYLCTFKEVTVPDVVGLDRMLAQLADDSRSCILRARVKPEVEQPCRRITKEDARTGDAPTLDDVPRAWVLIDFDSIDEPDGVDFRSKPHVAAAHLRDKLPEPFRAAACVWRASSSAGFKPGIRLHLWFLLSAELDTAQLTHWLRGVKCDKAPFRTNQPHFTANPQLVGLKDPMSKRRGILQGAPRVRVPDEIEQYEGDGKERPVPRGGVTSIEDPLKAAALRRWERAHPFDDPGSSERLGCPACGSPDGIAVREDGRWNCHSSRHVDEAPHIGTYTGSVYVGHRIEFQEGLTPREVVPWLKNHGYWGKHTLSERMMGRRTESGAAGAAAQIVEDPNEQATAAQAMRAGVAMDEIKPTARQLKLAHKALDDARKRVQVDPTSLDTFAEDLGRWLPHLNETLVVTQLRDAAVRAPASVALTAEAADAIIRPALERGKKRPHVRPKYDTDEPQLPVDEHGQPARCEATVYYYCKRPQIESAIALDDRAHRVVVIDVPPWWTEDDREFPRQLEDADLPRIASYIAGRFGYAHAGVRALMQSLNSVAQDRRWDPVEDYLDDLTWDGTEDEARQLLADVTRELLGVTEDTAYTRAVFMRWAIAAVQRTYEPGCQYREVLTLIGPQNIGKSQFFRSLCADPVWYTASARPSSGNGKDHLSVLDGKWIVELSELDRIVRGRDAGDVKDYISTQIDSYRRAYAQVDMDMRRRCVFGATSNKDTDLFSDDTGNTRFNVLKVTAIDIAQTLERRDMIWAAAKHLYLAGEPSYLQGEECALAAAKQSELYAEDDAESLLGELWGTPVPVLARTDGGGETELGFAVWRVQLDPANWTLRLVTHEQLMRYLQKRGIVRGRQAAIRRFARRYSLQSGGVPDEEAWGSLRRKTAYVARTGDIAMTSRR